MYIFENELLVTMAVQQSPHGYGGGVVYFFSRLSSVFDILQTHSECTAPTCTPNLPTSSEHTYFGNFTNIDNPDGGRRLFDPACSSLTLRRLMSYIYMEHPFLMFLDHTQRRSTVGRTPLDE